jgi:NADH:ubiquinone oxidoreductase subunit 4 (subunit M)
MLRWLERTGASANANATATADSTLRRPTWRERAVGYPLLALLVVLGIAPQQLLEPVSTALIKLIIEQR